MDAMISEGNLLPALLCGLFLSALLVQRVARWRARSKSALAASAEKPVALLTDRQLAKASGSIVAGSRLLTAPLSRRRCAGYRLLFISFVDDQELREIPIELGSTSTLLEGIWIEDSGTRAYVSLDHARVFTYRSRRRLTAAAAGLRSLWDLAPAAVRCACKRRGICERDLICVEEVLEPGALVSVIGMWSRRPAPEGLAAGNAYREPGFVPYASGSTNRPVIIADDVARLLSEVTDHALLWAADPGPKGKGSPRP